MQGIEDQIGNIVDFFINELAGAKSEDYMMMLNQGIFMCFWYSVPATL